ncbi:MAG: hypothetical protein V3W00_08720, partial [Candidatus Brocadiales bacterium]
SFMKMGVPASVVSVGFPRVGPWQKQQKTQQQKGQGPGLDFHRHSPFDFDNDESLARVISIFLMSL